MKFSSTSGPFTTSGYNPTKSWLRRFRRLIGLTLLSLMGGGVLLIWPISVSPSSPNAAARLTVDLTEPHQTQVHPAASSTADQAELSYLLTFGQGFDLGPIGGHAAYNQVTDAYGEPFFLPPQVQMTKRILSLPFFGSTIELAGRWWMVEGERRYVGGYLKISLMNSRE